METEGTKHYIQMNKWKEVLEPDSIEGQQELVPVDGRDYVLQMIVSPTYTTINAEKTINTVTLKRIGGWKLIAISTGEELKEKLLDE